MGRKIFVDTITSSLTVANLSAIKTPLVVGEFCTIQIDRL
jgi:hypothetical protein